MACFLPPLNRFNYAIVEIFSIITCDNIRIIQLIFFIFTNIPQNHRTFAFFEFRKKKAKKCIAPKILNHEYISRNMIIFVQIQIEPKGVWDFFQVVFAQNQSIKFHT